MKSAGKENKKNTDKSTQTGAAHRADFTSQKAAAAYAGVKVRTIQRWKSRGMPVIDLGAGKVGYTKSMLDKFKRMAEGDALNAELKTEEIGLKGIKRQLALIELKQKRGELIPAEQVEREKVERILAVKRALLGWPRKMPPRLKGRSMQRMATIIREEIYYVLNVFAGKKLKPKRTGKK